MRFLNRGCWHPFMRCLEHFNSRGIAQWNLVGDTRLIDVKLLADQVRRGFGHQAISSELAADDRHESINPIRTLVIEQGKVSTNLASAGAGNALGNVQWPCTSKNAEQPGLGQGGNQLHSQSQQLFYLFRRHGQVLGPGNRDRTHAQNANRPAGDEDIGIARFATAINHATNHAVIEDEKCSAIAAHRYLDPSYGRNLLRPASSGINYDFALERFFFSGVDITVANA